MLVEKKDLDSSCSWRLPVEHSAAPCEGLSVRTKRKHSSGSSQQWKTQPAQVHQQQGQTPGRAGGHTELRKNIPYEIQTPVPQKWLSCAKKSTRAVKFSRFPERRNEGGQEAFPTQHLLIPPEASGGFTPQRHFRGRREAPSSLSFSRPSFASLFPRDGKKKRRKKKEKGATHKYKYSIESSPGAGRGS